MCVIHKVVRIVTSISSIVTTWVVRGNIFLVFLFSIVYSSVLCEVIFVFLFSVVYSSVLREVIFVFLNSMFYHVCCTRKHSYCVLFPW